jgi:hypothetical protein
MNIIEITLGLIDVHFLLVVEGTSQIFPLHVYVLLQHVNNVFEVKC